LSRKAILPIGVIATTFFTLLILLAQNARQLIILRSLPGLGASGVWSAVFRITAELMPAHLSSGSILNHVKPIQTVIEHGLAGKARIRLRMTGVVEKRSSSL
jgi:MFS family permease